MVLGFRVEGLEHALVDDNQSGFSEIRGTSMGSVFSGNLTIWGLC